MLSRGGVNYWISWADLTFMLFVAALATVALSEEHRQTAETRLAEARRQIDDLRQTTSQCANASPFLTGFSSCVSKATGLPQLQLSGCFVTVGEDVIRFPHGKAVPLNPSAADAVARCLHDNALQFAAVSAASFEAITIHVDGHTDCVGTSRENQALGASRALSVYSRVLARAESASTMPAPEATRFLSRFAVRSFGETRPVPGSRCTQKHGWPADRRVVVSVQLATERGPAEGLP